MESLYAKYLKEITYDHIIEDPRGFVTYRYLDDGKTVYIVDIFVVHQHRREGVGSVLASLVCDEARKKGCTEVLGTVVPTAKGCTEALKAHLAFGMKLHGVATNSVILRKDL